MNRNAAISYSVTSLQVCSGFSWWRWRRWRCWGIWWSLGRGFPLGRICSMWAAPRRGCKQGHSSPWSSITVAQDFVWKLFFCTYAVTVTIILKIILCINTKLITHTIYYVYAKTKPNSLTSVQMASYRLSSWPPFCWGQHEASETLLAFQTSCIPLAPTLPKQTHFQMLASTR